MIRLAIAHEHALVRWAFRHAFAGSDDIVVVGEAGTVDDTLGMVWRDKPDVLLLDLALPDHSGNDVLKELRELDAPPSVLMFGAPTEPIFAARAVAAGALGYVALSAKPEELLEAIRAVDRGERAISPNAAVILAGHDFHAASALTRRELEVMELLARGLTNREIAEHLTISVKTVDTHRGHILKKLELRNNAELARFAVKHGYVSV